MILCQGRCTGWEASPTRTATDTRALSNSGACLLSAEFPTSILRSKAHGKGTSITARGDKFGPFPVTGCFTSPPPSDTPAPLSTGHSQAQVFLNGKTLMLHSDRVPLITFGSQGAGENGGWLHGPHLPLIQLSLTTFTFNGLPNLNPLSSSLESKKCCMCRADGKKYSGEWANGKRDGKGTQVSVQHVAFPLGLHLFPTPSPPPALARRFKLLWVLV